MQRKDDNAEALKKRMASYNNSTAPILEYYRKKNILTSVQAMDKIDNVWNAIHGSIYSKIL